MDPQSDHSPHTQDDITTRQAATEAKSQPIACPAMRVTPEANSLKLIRVKWVILAQLMAIFADPPRHAIIFVGRALLHAGSTTHKRPPAAALRFFDVAFQRTEYSLVHRVFHGRQWPQIIFPGHACIFPGLPRPPGASPPSFRAI